MREILFRGKSVFTGKWVFGVYSSVYGGKPIIITDCDMEDDCSLDFEYEHVKLDTLGQYTGLTDKNKMTIFEGDIIEAFDFDVEDGYGVIRWDEDTARFIIEGRDLVMDFDNYYGYELEVIGNIYDTPELLEDWA